MNRFVKNKNELKTKKGFDLAILQSKKEKNQQK